MGLRFRNSIKLAPGLRLNLSGSGLSLTAGPRGASVSFGSRGTYLNTGIPGTGLYSRQRLGGDTSSMRATPAKQFVTVHLSISVDDEGQLTFKDSAGAPVTDYLINKAKRERGSDIRQMIEGACEKLNAPVKALSEIHLETPAPTARIVFKPQQFEDPMPLKPVLGVPGFFASFFKSRVARIEDSNRRARAEFEADTAAWKTRKAAFTADEVMRKEFLEQRIFTDTAAMEQHLQHALEDISWPRETIVSFEVGDEGKTIAIDVDLPEIEDLPKRTASLPATGYQMKLKPIPDGQLQKLYASHIHGVGFRIIGETFALLPTLITVALSAYSQRPNAATGVVGDEYLYSVRATRDAWAHINFANLSALDVVTALERFELRREMLKSGRLRSVVPFSSQSGVDAPASADA